MKYSFTYRTSDNVIHRDVISASSHDDVYRRLRPRGIRPYNVVRAPGFLNLLCLPGKRGWSIIVLCALLLVVVIALVGADRRATRLQRESQGAKHVDRNPSHSPRHQIAAIPDDWLDRLPHFFASATDRFFALYAQPGYLQTVSSRRQTPSAFPIVSFGSDLAVPVLRSSTDPEWVADMKSIVAGMKEEAFSLRRAGKSDAEIALWLSERQRMEADYRRRIVEQVHTRDLTPAEANRMLSAMGLKTIPRPRPY